MIARIIAIFRRRVPKPESREDKWARIVFPASWEKIKQDSRLGL